ncbi:MAG: hypothetical protein HY299_11390 [Verrucomicrobia bacterium]|nr:hypothetical protein [Verrucomicrobiota bacterium]
MKPFRPVGRRDSGALLLEVILALVIFVAAAAVLGVAFSASIEGVDRQKRQLHASDLAITVLSGVQLGTRPAASGGPAAFNAPFQDFTWQLVVTPLSNEETGAVRRVEVTIRHKSSPLVYRLAQWLNLSRPTSPPSSPPPAGPASQAGGNS